MTSQPAPPTPRATTPPPIIQGGMGVGVSSWQLARAVARRGMIGVVSGTGLDQVVARRLQLGDADGTLRQAFAAFPFPAVAESALQQYFLPEGKAPAAPFRISSPFRIDSPPERMAFAALAAFAEVWRAKQGHTGPVGINLLEKIALPNPALLYGAMLAGVDYVTVGAGIPWQIPGILDSLSRHEPVSMRVDVEGDAAGNAEFLHFDPTTALGRLDSPLKRPRFLAIISSATLAQALLKRATGTIEGFIVEGPTAGGHNAPPRGAARLNDRGEPIYGDRDVVDHAKLRALGLPFWLAGGQCTADALGQARAAGAAGIQVGTLFAFCQESGLTPELRRAALHTIEEGTADVFTDPLASPTGFPFKVVRLGGTLSESEKYGERNRVCDAGYLRRVCRGEDGSIVYRCPAEPHDLYTAKRGDESETPGRKCLCNALFANLGLAQTRRVGKSEQPLLTAGDSFKQIGTIMREKLMNYTANDVLDFLLGQRGPAPA